MPQDLSAGIKDAAYALPSPLPWRAHLVESCRFLFGTHPTVRGIRGRDVDRRGCGTVRLVCEGLPPGAPGSRIHHGRFERPRPSPSSLTLRTMIGLGEDRCDPYLAGEPPTDANQSPGLALPRTHPLALVQLTLSDTYVRTYANPEWLNWLHPCHVACLKRSTEQFNSTLNDCNGRVLSSFASRGRLRRGVTDGQTARRC